MDPNINNLVSLKPPPLPSDAVYTSHYCEENVYLLAKVFWEHLSAKTNPSWDVYVVFISNHNKTVVLWNQKIANVGDFVVWDYHVILVLRTRKPLPPEEEEDSQTTTSSDRQCWVYDFDTRLKVPCHWIDYMTGTFPYTSPTSEFQINDEYVSMFRVISAEDYLDNFASDRSHMIRTWEDGTSRYVQPPPPYNPLCGPKALARGIKHNLMMSFVSMGLEASGDGMAKEGGTEGQDTTRREGEGKFKRDGEGSDGRGEVMDMTTFLFWFTQ